MFLFPLCLPFVCVQKYFRHRGFFHSLMKRHLWNWQELALAFLLSFVCIAKATCWFITDSARAGAKIRSQKHSMSLSDFADIYVFFLSGFSEDHLAAMIQVCLLTFALSFLYQFLVIIILSYVCFSRKSRKWERILHTTFDKRLTLLASRCAAQFYHSRFLRFFEDFCYCRILSEHRALLRPFLSRRCVYIILFSEIWFVSLFDFCFRFVVDTPALIGIRFSRRRGRLFSSVCLRCLTEFFFLQHFALGPKNSESRLCCCSPYSDCHARMDWRLRCQESWQYADFFPSFLR